MPPAEVSPVPALFAAFTTLSAAELVSTDAQLDKFVDIRLAIDNNLLCGSKVTPPPNLGIRLAACANPYLRITIWRQVGWV
jgi:hypothetical protein